MIDFYKYQGAGNDFILIDNRNQVFKGDKITAAKKWCNRRFGVGSDGLIFIENSNEADFEMDFYNPDGSRSFCGNGSRCAVAFAKRLGLIQDSAEFVAIDGKHAATFIGDQVKIGMNQYGGIELIGEDHFIDTGSPHYVSYRNNSETVDIVEFGRSIRYSDLFKEKGTNVNIIRELEPDHIEVRTYERGVEAETFACGTGATACGLSYAYKYGKQRGVVAVDAKGGYLKIHYQATNKLDQYTDVWLEGPAEFVFKGEIDG